MKQLKAVLWTGRNLEEVIEFVGKSRKFNEWFKSWEEYEKFVHEHGDIVKLFAPDGLSVDVLPGTWIVKTPEGFNVPMTNPWLKANKPEPQGLDEAAEKFSKIICGDNEPKRIVSLFAFKSGALWMAGQGITIERTVDDFGDGPSIKPCTEMELDHLGATLGDKVIVNIRKK